MKRPTVRPLSVYCFLLLSTGATAQHIAQISPPNISFRGVSIADSTHSMAVGDSATVILSNSGYIPNWHLLSSPCSKNHTLNGVSYYDSLHAIVISDMGLIFATSDEGQTWNPSGTGLTRQTLRGITHTEDGALITVGDSGIIFRSTDGGLNWSRIASSTSLNIYGLSINVSGHGYFVGQNGLVGKTTDYGKSWPIVTDTNAFGFMATIPSTLRAIAICTNDSAVAVGDSGAVGFTSDGIHWKALSGFPQSNVDSIAFYYPPESIARTSFRAVMYCPLRFEFGPGTWIIWGDNDISAGIVDSALFYPAPKNSISKSLDSSAVLVFSFNFLAGDADGGRDLLAFRVLCADYFSVNRRMDFGGSFEQSFHCSFPTDSTLILYAQPGFRENFLFASIDSMGFGYATCTGGFFLKTTDNGFSWGIVRVNDTSFAYRSFDATDIHTIDSNHAFAVGWSGNLFRTTNGGITWDSSNIDNNLERLQGISYPAKGVAVVVGDFGAILRSTNDGASWNYISQSITESFLEAVAFSSPEIGVAVGTSAEILRTADQGVTWTEINNPLTGQNVSFREIAAFPDGTYYTTTDSMGLWRSIDQGENWNRVIAIPNTISLGFYDENTAVVAEKTWSSAIVPDTMLLAFTRNGFATKTEFNIPIINNNRIVFHFIDSNTFLCFGSDGFVVKVEMSQGGASVTELSSSQTSPVQAFPNPCVTHSVTIEYDLDNSGTTAVELWNTLGEKVQALFTANELAGHHSQVLKIDPELHGAFFVKVISGTEAKMLPISIE